jgi:hypothetical protein
MYDVRFWGEIIAIAMELEKRREVRREKKREMEAMAMAVLSLQLIYNLVGDFRGESKMAVALIYIDS